MTERSICISFFTSETQKMFLNTGRRYLGHNKRIKAYKAGDIVLLYNQDTKEVFGICILRSITSNGDIYRETHLMDQELYTGDYSQYSKYEVGVKTYLIQSTPLEEIYRACDVIQGSRLAVQYTSFKKPSPDLSRWTYSSLFNAMIEEESGH